jgi:hypothetical protein
MTALSPTHHAASAEDRAETIEHLRELVRAIDKRSWHFERQGELEIARDAAMLRQKALDRIAELEKIAH